MGQLVLLVRHAARERSDRLVGRKPGIGLTDAGRLQAKALGERLADVPFVGVYTSPLARCVETAEAIMAGRSKPALTHEDGLAELDAGSWTDRKLADLAKKPDWSTIQWTPSQAAIPGGETLRGMQARMVDALERIRARHKAGVICCVSHEDPIKAAVAHYAGMPFDMYQRISVAQASVTAIAFGNHPPRLLRVSDTGSYTDFIPPKKAR